MRRMHHGYLAELQLEMFSPHWIFVSCGSRSCLSQRMQHANALHGLTICIQREIRRTLCSLRTDHWPIMGRAFARTDNRFALPIRTLPASLFRSQRPHRFDGGSAPSGKRARSHSDKEEERRRQEKREGIARTATYPSRDDATENYTEAQPHGSADAQCGGS